MTKLIAMDIDETITNPDGSVDPLAVAAIKQASPKDIEIAVVSAALLSGFRVW